MKVVKFELKRAFHSRLFLVSLIIGLIICIADLLTFASVWEKEVGDARLILAWIGVNGRFAYNRIFYVLLPVLACLPYGGSYYTDMSSGYEKNICIKTSRSTYMLAKGLAVFSSAFVGVALPLLVNLFLCAGLYPNYYPEKLTFLSAGILDNGLFPVLYHRYPHFYCLVFIFIDGVFGGLMGLLSLCVSKLVESHFTAVVSPFVLYVVTGIAFQGTDGTHHWSLMQMLSPDQTYVTLSYRFIAMGVGIFVCSLLVLWKQTKRRDIL